MVKTLIVCEKPAAAAKIAEALAKGKARSGQLNGVPYYDFEVDGRPVTVVPALGHLFVLKNLRPLREYPFYEVGWVPAYLADRRAKRTKAFIEAICELAKGATEFISACDYDVEGSVIGANVLRYICGEEALKRARRMKFSTLTAEDLRRAYEQLMPRLDYEQIEAGETRHILDWFWGMNLSLAMSMAVKLAGQGYVKLSAGRVQTPTLRILVDREREIKAFRPETFWVVDLVIKLDGAEAVAEHASGRFFDRLDAERVLSVSRGKPARVSSVQVHRHRRSPPVPFSLGDLQLEAHRCFGFSPLRTQQIAQELYLAALISYPRTDSQKLPPSIDYRRIMEQLGSISEDYKKMAEEIFSLPELKPNEGKKTDPAHPAIYPTGQRPENLTAPQRKLYDLIVRRFFSVFGMPSLVESLRVEVEVGGEKFILRGRRVLEEGWLKFYGGYSPAEEIMLPELREGQLLEVKEVRLEEGQTQPPPRYNPASIVKKMEEIGIGTKGTRAQIVQSLYERGYITGRQITVTDLGMQVIDSLTEYCPEITSEELTAEFEREMDAILEGKRTKEEVAKRARAELDRILSKFKQHQLEIGKKLAEAYHAARLKQRKLGRCPSCGGDLMVVVSRATHKRFVGCSNYPKCLNSFPLPQVGTILPLGETCKICGAPMAQVDRTGSKSYRICLNPKCPSKVVK
ncbi:MAG: DNA topoisomerase I [Candidatus Hadarchaeum sp.]|uniref:DNA topoisomerase I n=1 Tax=Candidatus Hadarchaeum sp. TaxID=2883567 RepID=UPI003180AE88